MLPVVIDVGSQGVLTAELEQRRRENPGLLYAVIVAADLHYVAGDALPDFFGPRQS